MSKKYRENLHLTFQYKANRNYINDRTGGNALYIQPDFGHSSTLLVSKSLETECKYIEKSLIYLIRGILLLDISNQLDSKNMHQALVSYFYYFLVGVELMSSLKYSEFVEKRLFWPPQSLKTTDAINGDDNTSFSSLIFSRTQT